jgi:predicted deacylase
MLEIQGIRVEGGTKKETYIGPDAYPMPAFLIAGRREGKTILVTAQIHSGEYPGTPAVIRIGKKIDPEDMTGNMILMPCVNVSGFQSGYNTRIPEDDGNLNADYPAAGKLVTDSISSFFINEVFPKADFILDLHSGGITEPLTPCLFYPALAVTEESLAVGKKLDIPWLVASENKKGHFSYAAHVMNIPGLLLERGFGGLCEEEWIRAYEKDIRLAADALGILPCRHYETCEKELIRRARYISFTEDGLWYRSVKPGDEISKGQVLGHTEDYFGNVLREYRAEEDGIVLYGNGGLKAAKGHLAVAYGRNAYREVLL